MMSPSSLAVLALKFLQKSMMFSPCGPSAVPTGGAGVALPAAICSFTDVMIFFAIVSLSPAASSSRRLRGQGYRARLSLASRFFVPALAGTGLQGKPCPLSFLEFLDLQKI